ncbi:hypothetical protein RHSP_23431 [Rhizobium freirei PRF 81]|uniref:Uncharacterized protein n=1 Tax=Rhizobium freirei PRF 81 TaxID=363754 RepID=N6VCL1_9HYPH|nr:hypothetical protein RHSP_23431 [Rhizobium freirei PRF 81]
MLDDRSERERREEGQAANDQDRSDQQTDEERTVGREGAGRGGNRLLGDERTGNRERRHDDQEAADEHDDTERGVVPWSIGRQTSKGRTVIRRCGTVGIEDLREAVRAGIADSGDRRRQHGRDGGEDQHAERQAKHGKHRHLHFLGLDLLAEIFRRAADHQACDEDGDDDEHQDAVEAGADAADDDFAELQVDERDHAAKCRKAAEHAVDRAAGCRGRDDGEQRGGSDAEANFLAFHIAALDAKRMDQRIACCLGPVGHDHAGDEQRAHRGQDGPALTLAADHAAEDVGQRSTDGEDRQHLDEVGERVRVLERMSGVGVEETAAIRAEHLDGKLRGNRANGDRLLHAFERRRIDIGAERLRHAKIDVYQRQNDADRQQDIERRADHIDPEIADRLARGARECADQRDGDGNAGCRRHEVLHRQAGHLHEVGHRAFAAIVLPIGIGDEAGRRVERQIWLNRSHAGRVIRQTALQSLQQVKSDEAGEAEQQHGDRIGRPVLLFAFVRAGQAIKPPLQGTEDKGEECALAGKDTRHVTAERFDEQEKDPNVKEDLKPSVEGHGSNFPYPAPLEALGANESIDQVSGEKERHAATENVIEKHCRLSD